MSFKGRTVRVIMMTIEERKEKFIPLRAIRGTQRSIVTKNVTKVSNIVEDETLTTSVQVQHLEVVSRLTETKLSFLGDNDQEILSLCSLYEIPQKIEESERHVEKIITCQNKINDTSQQTNGTTQETINPLAGLIQTLPGGILQQPINQFKAKLPKLILPKFRDDVTTWTGFWDSYQTAVHDNENISKIDKFNYFISLLEGATSQAIQALSSSNYD